MTFNPIDERFIQENAGRIGYSSHWFRRIPDLGNSVTSGGGTASARSDGTRITAQASGDEALLETGGEESRVWVTHYRVVFGTGSNAAYGDFDVAAVGNISAGNETTNGHHLDLTTPAFVAAGTTGSTLPGLSNNETYVLDILVNTNAGETTFVLSGHADANGNNPYYESETVSDFDSNGSHNDLARLVANASNSTYLNVLWNGVVHRTEA